MLDDSFILDPRSATYFTSLLEAMGRMDSWDEFVFSVAGNRNGRDPVGDAWLFEATRR